MSDSDSTDPTDFSSDSSTDNTMVLGGTEAALNGPDFTHIDARNTHLDFSDTSTSNLSLIHDNRGRWPADAYFNQNVRHHDMYGTGVARQHARSVDEDAPGRFDSHSSSLSPSVRYPQSTSVPKSSPSGFAIGAMVVAIVISIGQHRLDDNVASTREVECPPNIGENADYSSDGV